MIGTQIATTLPHLRAQAESLMIDSGRIGPVETVFDPATNMTARTIASTVYEGKLRLRRGNASRVADVAGQLVTATPQLVDIPWDVIGVNVGYGLICDSGPLAGELLIVQAISDATHAVRQTLTVIREG